jgi:hypothetical protein
VACNYVIGDYRCYTDKSSANDVNISVHCSKHSVYHNQNSDTEETKVKWCW